MYELEEAITLLKLAAKEKDQTITIPIEKSRGYLLADDIYAPISVPSFPKSAMDGYAVRSRELTNASIENPIVLKVIGELYAGEYKEYQPTTMDAVRVMTGSYIPSAYDAVIKQEDTDYGDRQVNIYVTTAPYQNYCRIGEDIAKGDRIIQRNTRLTSLHIGILASLGIASVSVKEPLKVAILSTGNELLEIGQEPVPGKIYNSIRYMLASQIEACGFIITFCQNCADDMELLKDALNQASKMADIILTTGGISVGKKDLMPSLIEESGANFLFKGVKIQPGTHTFSSLYHKKIVISLSGNPYAALTLFELLFWPTAASMMNHHSYEPVKKFAVLKSEYSKCNRLRRFIRAYEEGGEVTLPVQNHSSSVIANLMKCNCFIDIDGGKTIKQGDMVTIWPIKEF